MSLPTPKSEQVKPVPGKITYLEILVIRVAGQWFGVRSDRYLRLQSFEVARLKAPDEPALTHLAGLLGELGAARLPVFDLAHLLDLPTHPPAPPVGQLIQITLNERGFGFAIDEAQEIQRVALAQLKQLPPIIKQLRFRPVVWAVWQRSSAELIPLLDFSCLLEKSTRQALQLGQG